MDTVFRHDFLPRHIKPIDKGSNQRLLDHVLNRFLALRNRTILQITTDASQDLEDIRHPTDHIMLLDSDHRTQHDRCKEARLVDLKASFSEIFQEVDDAFHFLFPAEGHVK